MNDIEELKQFVVLHARAQGITAAKYQAVLDQVKSDEEDGPGSWARQWTDAGAERERAGHLLDACRYYNIARFPFVDGPGRQDALDRCVDAFDRWRRDQGGIEPEEIDLPGGRVRAWTSGLSATRRLPLLLLCGGIVSVKEQWAPVLAQAPRLGMAGVVLEMPGVGQNTLPYDENSWQMIGAVLDAVADRADVSRSYAVALSFSGHLALRAAEADRRIAGLVLAGAPVSTFFTDTAWQARLPRLTVDTLGHLLGSGPAADATDTLDRIRGWALPASLLAGVEIPVAAIVSRADEIIPPGDARFLHEHIRDLRLMVNDDVHGSPHHTTATRLWTLLSVLRMQPGNRLRQALVGSALTGVRIRQRLTMAGAR